MSYTGIGFVNDNPPAINAENLNKMDNELVYLDKSFIGINNYSGEFTENQYVSYSTGAVGNLIGVNLEKITVSAKQKVNYNYTITKPDTRGIAFFDEYGIYISGVQTLSTTQIITVPDRAAIMFASVKDANDVIISAENSALKNSEKEMVEYVEKTTGVISYDLRENARFNNNKSNESNINTVISENWLCAKVSCEPGDVFYYSGYYNGNTSVRLYSFFDSSGNNVGDSGSATGAKINGTFTAPAGAKTLYFVSRVVDAVPDPYLNKGKRITDSIDDLESNCNELNVAVYGETEPKEILVAVSTYTSKQDSGGIDYTWVNNNTKCTVSGTRSGPTFCKIAGGTEVIPNGFTPGKTYNVVFHPQDTNIILMLLYYVNGVNTSSANFDSDGELVLPSNITGVEFRLSVKSGATVNETVDRPLIYTTPEPGLLERVSDLENGESSSTNPLEKIQKNAGLISLFHTVGCIGDSLSSGESAYKENGSVRYVDLYDFSWGQCLARLTDNTYYNFSRGGLTTKTWLESSYATQCFDGEHKCDAYFIGLGQNDKNVGMTVGTTADINLADYTQNADTYCGNYGKIIQKLQEMQPKAPIFVFTDPHPPMNDESYNNVLPDIVALFSNVWLIDLKTYGKAIYTDPAGIIGSQLRSGHYSALGYQQMAYVIATYVDWLVRNNLSAFSQVEFIGTNYEWTD